MVLLMCWNQFLNLYTLPVICYNILKMASIGVKWITSSSQTRMQMVVSGSDFPANFCGRICMSRIPCWRLLHILYQYLSGNRPCMRVCQTFRSGNYQLNKASGNPHTGVSPAGIGLRPGNILVQILVTGHCGRRCNREPVL